MKISKTTKKRILKLIFCIMIISILVISYTSVSFADGTSSGLEYNLDKVEYHKTPGFILLLLWLLRAFIAIIIFAATSILGVLLGSQLIAFNVETFIFNKYKLTSLKMFTGGANDALSKTFANPIAKWFYILFMLAIILELVVLIYIGISSVIRSIKHDPKKGYEFKKILKDFILGLAVLFGMGAFIVAVIILNNTIVSILANVTGMSSSFASITHKVALDIFSADSVKGTIAITMYIILATMGFVFFVYYLKRLLKVSFLILISPLVAVTFAIDRRRGGAKQLITWTKMFVFAVFIQSVHALLYVALVAVVALSIETNSSLFIPSLVIAVGGLKFIWDAEDIITKLFDMPVDKVQSSAMLVVGFLSQASNLGSKAKEGASKIPQLKTNKEFGPDRKFKMTRGAKKPDSSKIKDKIKDKPKVRATDKDKVKDKLKAKDLEKAKLRNKDKIKDSKRKTDKKDIKDKKQIKASKVNTRQSPLRSLGGAVGKSLKIQGSNLKKKLIKGAVKTLGGAIFAAASHATPKYSMFEAGIAGAAATGATMDKASSIKEQRKYRGKKFEQETVTKEAEQLNAIMDRKDKLGKDPEIDTLSEGEKLPEADEQKERKEEKDQEIDKDKEKEDQNIIEDKEKSEEAADTKEEQDDEAEVYAKEVMKTPLEDLQKAYDDAKERCIDELMRKTNLNAAKATSYVDKLQKDLLANKEFSYKLLEEADRNLLHRYLDLITKQKIDKFEAKRFEAEPRLNLKDEYNKVISRAKELRNQNDFKD